ncbi:MAG: tRNA uridine(34) 5-carboxymethylaminomethyl modification radical SAM/GNAT enzyme Elp3, partial [Candidatus Diapherotrites archaeon]
MQKVDLLVSEINRLIVEGKIKSKVELAKAKLRISEKLGLSEIPTNPDILAKLVNPSNEAKAILSIKPLRTLSGVAPIAIMTKPWRCPHGTCIYCPGGIGSPFGDVPQSYTGHEPATMRGVSNNFESYLQALNRITQYYATAHYPEKIELIIMGGTFPAMPVEYQYNFVLNAFKALNDFSEWFFEPNFNEAKFNEFLQGSKASSENWKSKMLRNRSNECSVEALQREHLRNEVAKTKIVTMCVETKPDWCKESHIDHMLELGTTRVELGVQTLDNNVLKFTNRGHTLYDTIEATRLLKDSGLKVTYHFMPGQPLSSKENDIRMLRELFENDDYKPDGLKIYPCMVMPGTALAKLYEKGKFEPLSTDEAAEIIAEAKRYFPEYTRIYRVQRDIPVKFSLSGVDKNNLRQIIEKKCVEKGIKCRCIRCREIGINRAKKIKEPKLDFVERHYTASRGSEVFISFEDVSNDLLIGFCRLRIPYKPFRKEFTDSTA